ncbi:MAG: YjjG family noncanonical pyrimidine nucleotidase [Spirochaetes bacterium]|nr:YjjG family noncanonical pyrimidine nucleotidase [Spirochaetota bacterium]
MKEYRLVFMDADETLFDFARAETFALSEVFNQFGLAADETALRQYDAINKECWRKFERGEMDQAALKVERFRLLFETMGAGIDPAEFGLAYLDWLSKGGFLLEGAEELCEYLSGKYRLALVTNGIAQVQEQRFDASPIRKYFEAIVISEEAGYSKPNPDIFEYACGLVDYHAKDRMIIVGDSLNSDIAGGAAFGIDTCWLNPKGSPRTPGIVPTYEIADLFGLRALL